MPKSQRTPAAARPSTRAAAAEKPRARRLQADRRRESMTHILDCAEAKFAENGFNGVTLGEVGEEAGVATALMRYYFGNKEELFRAVFSRRAKIINAERLEGLKEYRRTAGDDFTLEGIIEVFTRPAFDKAANDLGWRNYCAIVAYVNSSRGHLRALMSDTYDEVSRQVIKDMKSLFPDTPMEEIFWAYHFLTGAFTFSLGQTGRVDELSDGQVSSGDFAAIADRFPILMAAGVRALCAPKEKTSKRPARKRES